MPTNKPDIYQRVTDAIIDALETGTGKSRHYVAIAPSIKTTATGHNANATV